LALLVPALARADFADDYVAGLAALDHGEYAKAVQALQKALDAQPEPVARVMIEGNPQPYLPHHFLGMAQMRLGDCTAAGKEWDNPMNLRMLGRLRQLRNQEVELLAQCKPRAAAPGEKSTTPQSTQVPAAPAAPSPTATAPPAPAAKSAPKPGTSAASSTLPAALLRAYDDYVAARYAGVAKLDADALGGARARFQGYLLRSAARFALARLGDDKNLLEAARRDARAAQALDKATPDAAVFSPSFRAFYAAAH
jgi:tetratricopeptide (TPR) repeat protein